jgi:hypothetical protein
VQLRLDVPFLLDGAGWPDRAIGLEEHVSPSPSLRSGRSRNRDRSDRDHRRRSEGFCPQAAGGNSDFADDAEEAGWRSVAMAPRATSPDFLGTAARETNASRAAVPIISQSGDEAGSMQSRILLLPRHPQNRCSLWPLAGEFLVEELSASRRRGVYPCDRDSSDQADPSSVGHGSRLRRGVELEPNVG